MKSKKQKEDLISIQTDNDKSTCYVYAINGFLNNCKDDNINIKQKYYKLFIFLYNSLNNIVNMKFEPS